MIVSDVMLFVQEYAENVRAISKIDTESKGINDNTNDNNVFEVEKEDNEVENEVEKEVESSSHPLLDFITAADVFMYLGDVTYCTVLYCTALYCTVLHWTLQWYTILLCAVLYYALHRYQFVHLFIYLFIEL